MKIKSNQLLLLAVFSFVASITSSCKEDEGEKFTPSLPGEAFLLDAAAGSTDAATCTFADAWQATSSDNAYEITPASGDAGRFELVVKATQANTDIREREARLNVRDGKTIRELYLIQRGTPGTDLPASSSREIGADDPKLEFSFEGNVPVEVTVDKAWAKIASVEHSEQELLCDGKTPSEVRRTTVNVQVDQNADNAPRSAVVTVSTTAGDYALEIRQAVPLKVEWNREFYHRTAILRFTATWCYNCPVMAEAIGMAQKNAPGRIVPISMHASNSVGGLGYYQCKKFEERYNITGFPSGIANNILKIANEKPVENLVKVIDAVVSEATTSYPPRTAIHARSQVEGKKIRVDARIAVKQKDDYKIWVLLLESGIISEQDGADRNYEHNNILRAILTEELHGDPLPAAEGQQIVKYSLEAELPRSVLKPENLSVVIATVRPGNPDVQGVEKATYLELGTIWDNAVALPATGEVDFKYEE